MILSNQNRTMINASRFALIAMAGTVLGQVLSNRVHILADAALNATQQISGNWTVDLRTVIAVGTVVVLGAWRVSAWQQKLDDRLKLIEKRMNELPCDNDRCQKEE
jgi:hypothetical protein